MPEPAYVTIAGELARRIRNGELSAGSRLPSYSEIVQKKGVSEIVARKAMELLLSQGLARSVRRQGFFVADRPNLPRVSPERQTETAETTFRNESDQDVVVDRVVEQVPATEDQAEAFGIQAGDEITYTVTRITEGHHPVSISDTYQPLDVSSVAAAARLDETLADRLPTKTHAEWLRTDPGDLVKTVHQRFYAVDGRLLMMSDVSYPRDRYDRFVFRMVLRPELLVPSSD